MKRLITGFLLGALAMCMLGCATTNGTIDMEHERHATGIESHTSDH